MTILHLSHTNIRCDARIVKEMRVLQAEFGENIVGFGLNLDEGSAPCVGASFLKIEVLTLLSDRLRFLPRAAYYFVKLVEMTFVMLVRGIRIKPRIVHCHDTLVLLAGWLLKLTTGARLVYDAHELESEKNGQSRLLSISTLLIERMTWRRIDYLISVSQSIVDWYWQNLGRKPAVVVLNSPDNFTPSRSGSKYFHEKYGIQENAPVFVYVGQLSSGRGIECSLKVFSCFEKRAHLVFVGFGDLSDEIRSFASRYENIHLHEPVAYEQLVALIESADYGLCLLENVSLSDYYSLPNKLFEYCFAGLPVLASDFPEMTRLIEKYSLGVVCDMTVEGVDGAVREVLGRELPAISSEIWELSWPVQASRLIDAYKSLEGSHA